MIGALIEKELTAQLDNEFLDLVHAETGAPERIQQVLNDWLSFTRKKQTEDLPQKMEQFRKRISVLAQNVKLRYKAGDLVVMATGDSEITLRMLERGTDWFDPADDPKALIAGAILNKP